MIFPPLPVANYAGLLAAQAVAAQVSRYAPLDFSSGRDTYREGSGVLPLTDEGSWSEVWDQHNQNEQIGRIRVPNLNSAPRVDFRKNYVLALFAGRTRGVVGFRPVSGYVAGATADLRLVPVLDSSVASAVAIPTPWAFLVLPRTKATLKVELWANGRWTTIGSVKPTF